MKRVVILILALLAAGVPAGAGEREDLEVLQRTVVNLLEGLVEKGLLSADEASAMVASARADAAQQADQEPDEALREDDVRVTYVPEFVRDEIREQVKSELESEVVDDVIAHAERKGWAMTDALPGWVSNMTISGDVRMRSQTDLFDSGNALNVYRNFQAINEAGGEALAGIDAFANVSEDQQRLRARIRVSMITQINDVMTAGLRIATGDGEIPISLNQTLGQSGRGYELLIDRLYMNFAFGSRQSQLNLTGGRVADPWYGTELNFDNDLVFEGLVARWDRRLTARSDFFWTLGGIALEEIELSSRDKFLLGTQFGVHWRPADAFSARLALSYFDYQNITGKRNAPESRVFDFTAPSWLQRGNTLFDIRNDTDPDTNLFALAADYDIASAYLRLRFGRDPDFGVGVDLEYTQNIGFDSDDVLRRTGLRVSEETVGYHLGLDVGHENIVDAWDWRAFGFFRHIERDAIFDGFTDSNFGAGGTDSRGYVLGAELGLTRNTWLRTRWFSTNEIDGPPLGVEIFQFDINGRF